MHTLTGVEFLCHSRTFLSIISGVVAGIWGFTGLTGFVFYFLVMMVGSLGLLMKAKFLVHSYFDSWSRILIEGVLGGLMVSLIEHDKN
jgi:ER membrane protein complex subunit 6